MVRVSQLFGVFTMLVACSATDHSSLLQLGVQKADDCSLSVALLEENSKRSTVISPTGKKASQPSWEGWKLDSNKEMFLPATLAATKSMVTALASGETPDQNEILEMVLGKAKGALGKVLGTKPIAKAVTGILFAVLGSLLGEDEDMSQDDFYDMIMDEVKDMILKDRMRNMLVDVLHNFQDEIRTRDYLRVNYPSQYVTDVQHHDDEGTAVNHQRRIFHYQCWIGKWDHADCKEWEKNGAVVLGVRFAHWHLQTLSEIAAHHQNQDYSKFKKYMEKIILEGSQYVELLRHSWQTWHEAWEVRLEDFKLEDNRGQNCETSLKQYHTCTVKSTDNYAWPGCPKSRSCYRTNNNPWEQWIQSWERCMKKHKDDKSAYMNKIELDINALHFIVQKGRDWLRGFTDNDD